MGLCSTLTVRIMVDVGVNSRHCTREDALGVEEEKKKVLWREVKIVRNSFDVLVAGSESESVSE